MSHRPNPSHWTPEMDQLLMYMVQVLNTTYTWAAVEMGHEYPQRHFTMRSIEARYRRLKRKQARYTYNPADFPAD